MKPSKIRDINPIRTAILFLPNPKIWYALARFLWYVLKDFFFLQFNQAFRRQKYQVVNVNHSLDEFIPFTQSKIKIYLDFIAFWIRPFTLLYKKIGYARTTKLFKQWLYYIGDEYHQASKMYRYKMSTTNRPKCYKGLFRLIHAFDPHLLCVPSLHIAILALFPAFTKKIFDSPKFTIEEKEFWTCEIYSHSIEIAESVLYVKQHSVNCIAAALYMVSFLYPQFFTPKDATTFIGNLFFKDSNIRKEDSQAVREHITFMYERFLLEGSLSLDWREPIKNWIDSYSGM